MITEKEILRILNKYHGEAYGHGVHSSAFKSVASDLLFAIRQNTSSNNKYTAPQATPKSCQDFEQGKACKHGLRQACGVSCSCIPERV